MAKLVWFNQPTNHSGWNYFFYLTPDGEVGEFRMYMADRSAYILGGPALSHGYGLTDAAKTLISLLPAGFHFFSRYSAQKIRQAILEDRDNISDNSRTIDTKECYISVYSKAHRTTECCDMLINHATPESAIVFVDDDDDDGEVLLVAELAHIYYGLSKELREELGLKSDWDHDWQC